MKNLLKNTIAIIVFAGAIWIFRAPIQQYVIPVWKNAEVEFRAKFFPCSAPITYDIGTFDNRFGISKDYFLSALKDAEAIWEKPIGKNLFADEPGNGELKINLVYDYRQDATSKLANLGITVTNDKASYDSLQAKYVALKAEYDRLKSSYDAEVQDFNQKNQAYADQVTYWNGRGGAPKAQYSQLAAQRSALQSESEHLQATQDELNSLVDEINSLVVVLNRVAGELNMTVDAYNTIGASRGESFEEGLYQSGPAGREIDVYEFSTRDKLVRVLAHELGHALGMDHVPDKNAIMYEYNSGTNLIATAADVAELKSICHIK